MPEWPLTWVWLPVVTIYSLSVYFYLHSCRPFHMTITSISKFMLASLSFVSERYSLRTNGFLNFLYGSNYKRSQKHPQSTRADIPLCTILILTVFARCPVGSVRLVAFSLTNFTFVTDCVTPSVLGYFSPIPLINDGSSVVYLCLTLIWYRFSFWGT